MDYLRKGEIRNGSTGHHGRNRGLPPLNVGVADHVDRNCKGGGDDHNPGHLEHSWPLSGDVSDPVDGRALQKLSHLPLHPAGGELSVFWNSGQLCLELITGGALLNGSLLFLSAPFRKKAPPLHCPFHSIKTQTCILSEM